MNEKRQRFARQLAGTGYDLSARNAQVEAILSGAHTLAAQPSYPDLSGVRLEREGEEAVPTVCFSCHTTCEAIAFRDKKTHQVLRVEGDPSSPQTRGFLCSKGLASPDLTTNPNRVGRPLRRVGERGEGKFEPIEWDEALDLIAEKLTYYKQHYGPQGVALLEGTRRGWSRVYTRFANCFGTPNHGAAGWAQCLWPRLIDNTLTYGPGAQFSESQDYPNAHCILCWGVNPPTSWGVRAHDIMDARQRGAVLIVVDPYLSESAAKADIWLQPRPDTDMALALSMIHVIIRDGIYDEAFVSEKTFGFEELRKEVEACTPQWGSEITGVSADLIEKAAHVYAKAPASSLVRSLAIDQLHDSVQVCRAISILISITGNIDRPGSNVLVSSRGEISQNTHAFIKAERVSQEVQKLRCGYDQFPLLTQEHSPVPTAHMPTLWQQIVSGDPYPIPCAMIFGSNAAVSYTNSTAVEEALKKLEFLVVADIFMTPTAKYADIVLPASSWLERENMISSFQTCNTCTIFQQPATKVDDSRSDVEIVIGLARRLGMEDDFWPTPRALYDELLAPAGVTYEEGVRQRRLYAPLTYGRMKDKPFKTPSGKIELYSQMAEAKGCDPLPRYTPSFQSVKDTPELAKEYPLTMTTGRHENAFRISENRTNPYLLHLVPKAWLDIHPKTAEKLGIRDGQKVRIDSTAGTAYAYARYTLGLREDVVQSISGWWGEFNVNRTVPWGQYAAGVGTVCARGYLCRVTPVKEDDA
ncbi:MAG: molybdopterin-dependent oxidoreductase [Clostridia bacterium]|nr:molybdopterin-dependent oxidoreductase [Clostridia bacterium]